MPFLFKTQMVMACPKSRWIMSGLVLANATYSKALMIIHARLGVGLISPCSPSITPPSEGKNEVAATSS